VTIFKRSMITLSAAVFGFSSIFVISVLLFMNSLYYEVNMAGLEDTAKTLMTAIGHDKIIEVFRNSGVNQTETINLPFDKGGTYRLTLIAPSGYVLWDSHVTDNLVNHIDREEVIAALEGTEGSSRRESISTGMSRIYYSLPVFNNQRIIGVYRLSVSIPGFISRVSPIIIPFTVFFLIFIAAAFWAIIMYSRSLSVSFGRLVGIVQSSAPLLSGEPVAPEFRSLEKALCAMTEELNLRFEQAKSEGCRLEAILNGLSEAVFAMDNSLNLHLINPKAEKIFNLEGGPGISGGRTMTLLEATRSSELVDIAKKAISGGVPIETELVIRSGQSGEQYFQVYVQRLTAQSAGNIESAYKPDDGGVVLVLREITQLVKLERIRKDFVANVSHELRTPIQLIKGFSETLLDSINEGDKKQNAHFIEIINKNAGIMENLTNDLLVLSSLENNTINTRDMEECSVYSLINEAVSSLTRQAEKKQIEIIVNCPEDLTAFLHGSFIIQALINLLDNGIKYSPEKSKLWISTGLTAKPDPQQNAASQNNKENEELIIEIRDKGIGIPPEHLERIFERFYRVDRSRSRASEAGGTGLGLSIVRHIALLHNGKAEAESHTGEGSIFRISIPYYHGL